MKGAVEVRNGATIAIGSNGWIAYTPGYLDPVRADLLLVEIERTASWRQEHIVLFGRRVAQPRLTAWYGLVVDAATRYTTVSGASPWPANLAGLRRTLGTELGTRFNACLANLYRDGHDGVGWHADDETTLGPAPLIASVSLGATRRFLVRTAHAARGETFDFSLGHGDLVVMGGATQRLARHSVPKTARRVGRRINLTLRAYRADLDDLGI